jgi:hypothetical protein
VFFCSQESYKGLLSLHVGALDFDTHSLGYEENRKGVSERLQQSVCRETLIAWSSGFLFQCFSYQMKATEVRSLVQSADLDLDTHSLSYEENDKVVSERLQQQESASVCRETLGPCPSRCGFQCFFVHKKATEADFHCWCSRFQYSQLGIRRKTVREYRKDCNSQCAENRS